MGALIGSELAAYEHPRVDIQEFCTLQYSAFCTILWPWVERSPGVESVYCDWNWPWLQHCLAGGLVCLLYTWVKFVSGGGCISACWNCGGEAWNAKKCSQPSDQAKIEYNFKKWLKVPAQGSRPNSRFGYVGTFLFGFLKLVQEFLISYCSLKITAGPYQLRIQIDFGDCMVANWGCFCKVYLLNDM